MRNLNYKKLVFVVLTIIMTMFPQQNFALEDTVFKDLELFLQIYEMDEESGALFEMMEESKDFKQVSNVKNDEELKKLALSYIGKKYKYGGNGPDEYDCSGLVMNYYNVLGKNIPRTSALQSEFGVFVEKENLKVGDVVFFDTRSTVNSGDIKINVTDIDVLTTSDSLKGIKNTVTHNGIYIGDGKFVHASSGSIMRVVVEDLNSKYFSQRYVSARRYL